MTRKEMITTKLCKTRTKKIKFVIQVKNKEDTFFNPSLDFELQNSRGKVIEQDGVAPTDTDKIVRKLGKGTFYVRVTTNGNSVPYEIQVKKP